MTTLESYCFRIYHEIYKRELSNYVKQWTAKHNHIPEFKYDSWSRYAQEEALNQSIERVIQEFPLIDPNLITETIRKIHLEWDSDIILVD